MTLPSSCLEPGDLLLGPNLTTCARLWWTLPAETGDTWELLLPGNDCPPSPALALHPGPSQPHAGAAHRVRGDTPYILVRRDRDLVSDRLAAAARGALWLHLARHKLAPEQALIQLLVADYAAAAHLSLARAWSDTATAVRRRGHTPITNRH